MRVGNADSTINKHFHQSYTWRHTASHLDISIVLQYLMLLSVPEPLSASTSCNPERTGIYENGYDVAYI